MRALSLFLLRSSTGILLMLWGWVRFSAPETGNRLAEKYYSGLLSGELLQMLLGGAEILLGALVVLGLFRKYVYPLQALVLGFGLFAIWQYILDPFGIYLLEKSQLLFFPSTTLFAATLVILCFKEFDRYALDRVFKGPQRKIFS